MATLVVTGRRLQPRDGFPSALSALSTAAPGPLSRAKLDVSDTNTRSTPYVLHTGKLPVPLSQVPLLESIVWLGPPVFKILETANPRRLTSPSLGKYSVKATLPP
ncbi:hypothetical protein DPMN_043634 [Dreissena polymorpha]|uniref:Uncharacterized protein n=1 Tax=Dreissena polymorpha TaxID=45954 RepID=A0A9D4D4D4_DREPO|nr:hypothetical protein DPMN_043634 [Dreissena polymorpha]